MYDSKEIEKFKKEKETINETIKTFKLTKEEETEMKKITEQNIIQREKSKIKL
jgi:hypothetical protein